MKYYAFLIPIILSGCSLIPVNQKFPEPYTVGADKSMPACKELAVQEGDNIPITVLLTTIANNYKAYYDCKDHVDNWNKWYEKQKKIFDNANKVDGE